MVKNIPEDYIVTNQLVGKLPIYTSNFTFLNILQHHYYWLKETKENDKANRLVKDIVRNEEELEEIRRSYRLLTSTN